MANHFRDALEKLEPAELSALVAPLAGLIKLSTTEELDRAAVRRFLERYETALGAHGHRIEWLAPNGERFDGSMRTGVGERTRSSGEAPWRQLVFRVTGGEIGIPNQPEGVLFNLADRSATTLVRTLRGERAVLIWCWSVSAPPSQAEIDRLGEIADEHGDAVDVVGLGVGGAFTHAVAAAPAVDHPAGTMLWEPSPGVSSALGLQAGGMALVSPDLQRTTDAVAVLDEGFRRSFALLLGEVLEPSDERVP